MSLPQSFASQSAGAKGYPEFALFCIPLATHHYNHCHPESIDEGSLRPKQDSSASPQNDPIGWMVTVTLVSHYWSEVADTS